MVQSLIYISYKGCRAAYLAARNRKDGDGGLARLQHEQSKQQQRLEKRKQKIEQFEKDLPSTWELDKIIKDFQGVTTEREKVQNRILKINTILNNIDNPKYIDESIQDLEAELTNLHTLHKKLIEKVDMLYNKAEVSQRKSEESTK